MKTIYEHAIGGDGGVTGLYLEGGVMKVSASYPVAKLLEPLMVPLDAFEKKMEDLAPNWADPMIASAFQALKADIVKLLSE